jgi:hypothetical protein
MFVILIPSTSARRARRETRPKIFALKTGERHCPDYTPEGVPLVHVSETLRTLDFKATSARGASRIGRAFDFYFTPRRNRREGASKRFYDVTRGGGVRLFNLSAPPRGDAPRDARAA